MKLHHISPAPLQIVYEWQIGSPFQHPTTINFRAHPPSLSERHTGAYLDNRLRSKPGSKADDGAG